MICVGRNLLITNINSRQTRALSARVEKGEERSLEESLKHGWCRWTRDILGRITTKKQILIKSGDTKLNQGTYRGRESETNGVGKSENKTTIRNMNRLQNRMSLLLYKPCL